MKNVFSGKGDDGTTGWLGAGRIPKNDARIEALGNLDECTSIIGTARAVINNEDISPILVQIQRDIYSIMTEVASDSENAGKFARVDEGKIKWLEERISALSQDASMPEDFVLPGDSLPGAFVDNARTIVRRAERRVVELYRSKKMANSNILAYLNRLSSFLFLLEMKVNQDAGVDHPLLVGRKRH